MKVKKYVTITTLSGNFVVLYSIVSLAYLENKLLVGVMCSCTGKYGNPNVSIHKALAEHK